MQTAQQHNAQTLDRLPSVPGIGNIVRVVLRYEIPEITRFPRVQDVVSSCRLVTGAKASAGKREGTSGTQIGQASLTWAFSAAAVLCLRTHPAGQKSLARFELARAVSDMRKRDTVFARRKCLNGSGSGAGEPNASLDAPGLSLASGALMIALRPRTRRSTEALWPCSLGL